MVYWQGSACRGMGILLLVYLDLFDVLFALVFFFFLFFFFLTTEVFCFVLFFLLLPKELIDGSLPFCFGPRMFLPNVVKTNGRD